MKIFYFVFFSALPSLESRYGRLDRKIFGGRSAVETAVEKLSVNHVPKSEQNSKLLSVF